MINLVRYLLATTFVSGAIIYFFLLLKVSKRWNQIPEFLPPILTKSSSSELDPIPQCNAPLVTISIVIPVRNEEKCIETTLSQLMAQNYFFHQKNQWKFKRCLIQILP